MEELYHHFLYFLGTVQVYAKHVGTMPVDHSRPSVRFHFSNYIGGMFCRFAQQQYKMYVPFQPIVISFTLIRPVAYVPGLYLHVSTIYVPASSSNPPPHVWRFL